MRMTHQRRILAADCPRLLAAKEMDPRDGHFPELPPLFR
jgi:hypothetical protein